jgi:NADH-quinone oxidoreductase subunit H
MWYCFPFLPSVIIFFISILAETNRTPFDLPEAEAELVAGFNVEYSSTPFALFFLAEYSSILIMSGLTVILFFGGWSMPFPSIFGNSPFYAILKTLIVCFMFVFVRAGLPRYRYDQLMHICWEVFLPFSFGFFHFSLGVRLFSSYSLFGTQNWDVL